MNLWFFDSEDYNCYGVKGYGCIPLSVIDWYRKTSAELKVLQKGVKKGLAFMHIPFQEYMYAFNVGFDEGIFHSIILVWEGRMRTFVVRV